MSNYRERVYTTVEFYKDVVKKQWNLPRLFRKLNPVDSKRKKYLTADCPKCGKSGELFIYKESGYVKCNRKNECRFESSVLELASDIPNSKGIAFKEAIR